MLVKMTELDHMTSVKMATIEIELHKAITMEMTDSLLWLLSDGLLVKKVCGQLFIIMTCVDIV